ncbi:hypothetical protein [Pleionea litopenaei]|uniref:PAS domain-containing protein n=1 Tax=Pleionea litopenaei TaxID=3070815 RepID=A0AA51RSD1_9GAMM|nr:hypothetical protein [Pleionea sp. HL-JVS1]WMS86772.1 hypothetical protein Q9312_16240 [Pleionea sp. HL-JVS1]
MKRERPHWNNSYRVSDCSVFDMGCLSPECSKAVFEPLDELPFVAVVLNSSAQILFLNHYAQQTLKVDGTQAFGQSWIEQFIPIDQHKEIHHLFSAAMSGITAPFASYVNDVQDCVGETHSLFWLNNYVACKKATIKGVVSLGFNPEQFSNIQTINLPLSFECKDKPVAAS